jgi:hypothetical protein
MDEKGMRLRPQGRFSPRLEGSRGWRDGRPGSMSMCDMEEPDGTSRTVLFRRTSWDETQGRPPALPGLRGLPQDRAGSLRCERLERAPRRNRSV